MGHGRFRRAITIMTAAMLLVQSVTSLSAACLCGSQAAAATVSCCQVQTQTPADCCSQPKACCTTGHCGCGDSNPLSKGRCGCGDHDERHPYAPPDKSEQNQNNLTLLLYASHFVANTVVLIPAERLIAASTPPAQSASHSLQALLCIWQT